MDELRNPAETVSATDAERLFAAAANAMGGDRARPAGRNRVSIPVSVYDVPEQDPEPFEEMEDIYSFASSSAYIPSAVVFDRYEDDYEPSNEALEEEVAFSALEQALNRHREVYGDAARHRPRFHDYGFGRGISFDGPSYEDDEEE